MKTGDDILARCLTDSPPDGYVRRLRASRAASFIALIAMFGAALAALAGGQAALCGLFAAVAALNGALFLTTDMKIKLALLVAELKTR